MDHRDPSYITW